MEALSSPLDNLCGGDGGGKRRSRRAGGSAQAAFARAGSTLHMATLHIPPAVGPRSGPGAVRCSLDTNPREDRELVGLDLPAAAELARPTVTRRLPSQ